MSQRTLSAAQLSGFWAPGREVTVVGDHGQPVTGVRPGVNYHEYEPFVAESDEKTMWNPETGGSGYTIGARAQVAGTQNGEPVTYGQIVDTINAGRADMAYQAQNRAKYAAKKAAMKNTEK
jgi:hypothetical protein